MVERGGQYRVHDEHADFIQRQHLNNSEIRDRVLPPWREQISSVRALVTYSGIWLALTWGIVRAFGKRR